MATMHKEGDYVDVHEITLTDEMAIVKLLENESVATGWARCLCLWDGVERRYKVAGFPRICYHCGNKLFDSGLGSGRDRGRYCGACEAFR